KRNHLTENAAYTVNQTDPRCPISVAVCYQAIAAVLHGGTGLRRAGPQWSPGLAGLARGLGFTQVQLPSLLARRSAIKITLGGAA
ncbi:hypothetical protein OSJ20_24195, partial [Mycobacterium ulcerans]